MDAAGQDSAQAAQCPEAAAATAWMKVALGCLSASQVDGLPAADRARFLAMRRAALRHTSIFIHGRGHNHYDEALRAIDELGDQLEAGDLLTLSARAFARAIEGRMDQSSGRAPTRSLPAGAEVVPLQPPSSAPGQQRVNRRQRPAR